MATRTKRTPQDLDAIHELVPGLLHWTTHHEELGARVSSHLVEPAGVVIDPRVPAGGLDALAGRAKPQQAILTTGLHLRHAERFREAFGCKIVAPREARKRLGDAVDFEVYNDHDEIAPGVRAIEIDVLAPDEYALHVAIDEGAIVFADALTNYGGALGFFGDSLLGAHPDRVKAGLKEAFRGILLRDFDHLLFAHGDPIIGGGKAALREFLERPVGYPEYGQAL
jgi:hypothetical protein